VLGLEMAGKGLADVLDAVIGQQRRDIDDSHGRVLHRVVATREHRTVLDLLWRHELAVGWLIPHLVVACLSSCRA
jgi:hypothetical protein